MAIDRIDKTDRREYWQVSAPTESDKDKESSQGDAQEEHSDHFEAFGERTDWNILFDKSKLWKRNIQVLKEEIQKLIFRKINLKTDPSLLRLDIELIGGEIITPAFVAISRMNAFRIKHLKNGDIIPPDFLIKDGTLTVNIPTNPKLFEEIKVKDTEKKIELNGKAKPFLDLLKCNSV